MANTNRYTVLSNGALAHSAIENMTANGAIDMGSTIRLSAPIVAGEIQPRVETTTNIGDVTYGIAIGGDNDGVYGDGSASTSDLNRATIGPGQTVKLITRGRCPARVTGGAAGISIGDKLTPSNTAGVLQKLIAPFKFVAAVSLNTVAIGDTDMIIVEMVKEGFGV